MSMLGVLIAGEKHNGNAALQQVSIAIVVATERRGTGPGSATGHGRAQCRQLHEVVNQIELSTLRSALQCSWQRKGMGASLVIQGGPGLR